jgi:transcriptional regulator
MADREVPQGTLDLMILRTLKLIGPLHGYGIARRIEEITGNKVAINYGTLYPALLKLEQEGSIEGEWGVSGNNRKAKIYALTRAGRAELEREMREWQRAASIIEPFLNPGRA